ncbi:MAG: hypothetical protein IT559_09490 [Alphaproteobacteria bacterium]|nr:hypothetical protein [Alphaproteobacteria bacterium]
MELQHMHDGLARFENARFGFRVVRLCRGRAGDRPFYAFVAIEPQNLDYFGRHYQECVLSDFSVFGQELLRGWGETPPAEVTDHVRQKFGVEFDVDQEHIMALVWLASQEWEKDLQSAADGFIHDVENRRALKTGT